MPIVSFTDRKIAEGMANTSLFISIGCIMFSGGYVFVVWLGWLLNKWTTSNLTPLPSRLLIIKFMFSIRVILATWKLEWGTLLMHSLPKRPNLLARSMSLPQLTRICLCLWKLSLRKHSILDKIRRPLKLQRRNGAHLGWCFLLVVFRDLPNKFEFTRRLLFMFCNFWGLGILWGQWRSFHAADVPFQHHFACVNFQLLCRALVILRSLGVKVALPISLARVFKISDGLTCFSRAWIVKDGN